MEDGDNEHNKGDGQPEVDDGPEGKGGAWRGKNKEIYSNNKVLVSPAGVMYSSNLSDMSPTVA